MKPVGAIEAKAGELVLDLDAAEVGVGEVVGEGEERDAGLNVEGAELLGGRLLLQVHLALGVPIALDLSAEVVLDILFVFLRLLVLGFFLLFEEFI